MTHVAESVKNHVRNNWSVWILFFLFCIVSVLWLHRVPGLLGDEGSEGENVYELLTAEKITVVGERSYIGPFLDYVRIPFLAIFGYTTLGLRVPILLFSLATFWLGYTVLHRMFGKHIAQYAIVFFCFSPIYLLQQRIGWAITLIPFFTFLILFFLQSSYRTKWLWAGLAAGIGLANHILFFPTLAALAVCTGIYGIYLWITFRPILTVRNLVSSFLQILVGFWAGFGSQFVVLQMFTDDQGDTDKVTQLFSERLNDFKEAWLLYVSGSSYVARYTGVEFSSQLQMIIVVLLGILILLACILLWRKGKVWLGLLLIAAHLVVMMYMIDRFTLRYFVMFSLMMWGIAGVGLGALSAKALKDTWGNIGAIAMAVLLSIFTINMTFIPFLRTGGSLNDFSLGNRTNSAADFVDVRPLIACVRGKGPVFSENIHIWNRLQYFSHQYDDIQVVPEDKKKSAQWLVVYKDEAKTSENTLCPELQHFQITSVSSARSGT